MPRQEALLLNSFLLNIFGTIAMDEQPMVVHTIRSASHKRQLISPWLDGEGFNLVGPHHLRTRHLVRERLAHGMQKNEIALFESMDVVKHAEVAHAGMSREHAVGRRPAHGQACTLEMANAGHEHFFTRTVVDGHAHVNGRNLNPAHHGVAIEYKLIFIGLHLVGGKLGAFVGKQFVVRTSLKKNPFTLLRRKSVYRARHGVDLIENTRSLKSVKDPGPHHQTDADENDDHSDKPIGPARQTLTASLIARSGGIRRYAIVSMFHRLGASNVGRHEYVKVAGSRAKAYMVKNARPQRERHLKSEAPRVKNRRASPLKSNNSFEKEQVGTPTIPRTPHDGCG